MTGLSALQANVQAFPKKLVRSAVRNALAAAIEVVGKEVTVRCPVDKGEMRDAIKTEVHMSSTSGTATVGFNDSEEKGVPVGIIALWNEIGHALESHGGGGKGRRVIGSVAPRPFMRPALIASADAALEAFAESISESLPDLVSGTFSIEVE